MCKPLKPWLKKQNQNQKLPLRCFSSETFCHSTGQTKQIGVFRRQGQWRQMEQPKEDSIPLEVKEGGAGEWRGQLPMETEGCRAATLEEAEWIWRKENEEMEEDRNRRLPHVSWFLNGNWNLWFSHNYLWSLPSSRHPDTCLCCPTLHG